jgi:hypothetical protein
MAKGDGRGKQDDESELSTLEWLETYPEVRYSLQDIRGGEAPASTTIIFAGCLRKYCEFRGMTPEELVDEGEADLRRGKKGR